ncbi:TonB-dependent receptor [Sphingomonas xinjiangensis]|uniref:Outer membrane receptor protein involved in Fe transport n=1 Tax=Sphingomonas xinjiangensis TaxID=643568 RepID=A0A840YU02_9SPHN|nr:TonB-dependent receptor [Sphingomonas xinjiangensis]MBB5713093.1 outer membrane receptor protein involved in Fe transport [Sphingomonas xinjiangensis]
MKMVDNMRRSLLGASATVALVLAATGAEAQTSSQPQDGAAVPVDEPARGTGGVQTNDPEDGGEVIVTARAGNQNQAKVEASYAISTISSEELKMKAPVGVGEALKNVPGFWVESSSGETSGNVRVRGIPTDGYSQVALLEDGVTIQHDPGLGWLNGDQSFRIDQTLERVEVVRGGPSSLFYSNAPGAVINFIQRRGGNTLKGLVRYEGADYNAHRVDGWIGGPIGDSDWRFFVGGFYRLSDGQRHTGYRLGEGGQVRATLSRDWDGGSFMFSIKHLDERVENAMVTPFVNDENGDPVGVPGFDALDDTIAGKETRYFNFRTPTGTYAFDAGLANKAQITQVTTQARFELGPDFSLLQSLRYRDSYQKRNSITPRTIYTYADVLTSLRGTFGAALPTGAPLGLVYTNGSGAFSNSQNGNGLVLLNLARSFTVPESEVISDTRLQKTLQLGGQHDVALGLYYAYVDEDYRATSASILTDVKNNASLLDVALLGAGGVPGAVLTESGVLSYGTEFGNSSGRSRTVALYASDEWKITDQLRLDGGVRWEQIDVSGFSEGSVTRNLAQTPASADNAVQTGNGVFTGFKGSYDHAAWSLGVNYQFQPRFGIFARYTSTYRLPGVSSFFGNPSQPPVTQTMKFQEVGIKFDQPAFNLFVTGFRTAYESYQISDYRQNGSGQFVLNTVFGNTETWGAEVEGTWRPVPWFDIHANYTYQRARFSDFVYTNNVGQVIDYSENRLIRVPEHQFRITPGVNLLDGRFRLEADVSYYGQRWADVANQINLPSYATVDLNARFDLSNALSLNLYVNNLTDTIGLTEGNPRAGTIENEEVGDAVYIARSIFGRSVRGAVTFRF